jgi:hypothetical protein
VPARSSSPIPTGLGQLAGAASSSQADHPGLLARLASVPDPRRARGRRHPLVFVLALAACAVLAGARSLAAIADLGFIGLDDTEPDADPTVITGYKAARNRPLTRGRSCPTRHWPRSGPRSSTASPI